MPDEPSESSSESNDAAILGLDDTDLDPEPEISDDVTPVESPSEDEEEGETESKEAASEEPAEGETPEAESAEPETPPDSEPAPFKFLGKEYKSIDDAEHALKSYLGQVSAKDKQIDELTGLLWNLNDRMEASESRKEETPAQSKGEPKGAESKPKSFWDAFDFETFENEVENKGLCEGMEYLVYKVDEHLSSIKDEIRQDMSSGMAPFQAWQEQMSEFNESYQCFADLANRVDEKGEPLYPELQGEDTAFIQRVAERWLNIFTPEERKRQGAYGAHIAYVLQKAEEVATPEETLPPPSEEPKKPGASEALKNLNRQANQGLSGGVLTGTSNVKPTSRRSVNDQVNAELEEMGDTMREPLLGI